MKAALRVLLVALFLPALASVAFADVAPAPDHPDIYVYLDKGGIPYGAISSITYHCEGSNSTDTGSVSQKLINLTCISGVCNNDLWFYKFNPCYLSSGFFSYDYNGVRKETRMLDLNGTGTYTINVEVETGSTQVHYNNPPPGPPEPNPFYGCLPFFLLPLLLAAAVRAGK